MCVKYVHFPGVVPLMYKWTVYSENGIKKMTYLFRIILWNIAASWDMGGGELTKSNFGSFSSETNV